MIKNRESAARSRLRRQQHTEALEEQNAGLRAELAALHSQVGGRACLPCHMCKIQVVAFELVAERAALHRQVQGVWRVCCSAGV